MFVQDRLAIARALGRGKKVLDIGGMCMPATQKPPGRFALFAIRLFRLFAAERADQPKTSGFAQAYEAIRNSAAVYKAVDYHDVPPGHYEINFNEKDSIPKIRQAIDEYRPEVILCMETLEHINYHFELMNEMARAISLYGTTVFISIPNNLNWILNGLGFNFDHVVAFFPKIARRFVTRSDLGKQNVTFIPCTQKYVWFWWIIHLVSLFQPFSLGFLITKDEAAK